MNAPDKETSAASKNEPSQSGLLDSDSDFPDGGWTAWLTTLGAQVLLIKLATLVS